MEMLVVGMEDVSAGQVVRKRAVGVIDLLVDILASRARGAGFDFHWSGSVVPARGGEHEPELSCRRIQREAEF